MPTKTSNTLFSFTLLLVLGALAGFQASPASAAAAPSSDLLLPWFEVHLAEGRTTLFAVGNSAAEAVTVKASVTSNWGIPVLERSFELAPGEVRTVNLRDWVVAGDVPAPALGKKQLAHVQAALTGQPSPKDGLYYGAQADPFDPALAAGFVTLRVKSAPRHDSLWGDYFWVDPGQDFAEGELLVNIDELSSCGSLCDHHRVRFLDGGGFDGGTKLVVWTPRRRQPSPIAEALTASDMLSLSAFHTEPGKQFDERLVDLLPVQLLDLRELHLSESFGWMDIVTEEPIYVGVRYAADRRYSVTLQTWCIPEPLEPPEPPGPEASIDIEKSTNGEDADDAPGVEVAPEGAVVWEYRVTNTGDEHLTAIEVTDDMEGVVDCPETELAPGDSMTCTLESTAPAAAADDYFYANVGSVTGTPPTGSPVVDEDPSRFWVPGEDDPPEPKTPRIGLEKTTNGVQADTGRGPELALSQTVTWSYVVTNLGNEALENVQLTDDREGAIACPKSTLAVGESMTCVKAGVAALGDYRNVGTVTGKGVESGKPVDDDDPSAYHVEPEPPAASVDLEKATNGHDADTAPGPQLTEGDAVIWTYVVTNDGEVPLTGVTVTDDREGAVACPKSSLAVGESMTCSGSGVAGTGQYANVGTVQAQGAGQAVSDSDPSHYFGEEPPEASVRIEKATNGHDADSGPGPQLTVGDPVTWTYVVTNDGEIGLTGVSVTDDREGAISCPKATLAVGESMTCTLSGTAVAGQYTNLGTVTGTPQGGGSAVSDTDPSHYHAEAPPPECGDCEGKVTRLTLRYLGAVSGAHVQVTARRGPSHDPVFDGIVFPGDTFEVVGPASGNPGFSGTLGTEITIRVNGSDNAKMHTSCSSPIGPGLVAGDFEVVEGGSSGGGLLCPL
jgi:hypothetical protein